MLILSGNIFRLLRLDENLVVVESTTTGPDFDHTHCNPNKLCEHDKSMTDNVNKLLLVEASKRRIISCSTLYQVRNSDFVSTIREVCCI